MKPTSTLSWMALLAATSLGPNAMASTVRANVRGRVPLPKGEDYRLVVHSYDAKNAAELSDRSRPVGSMQRAVTAEDLEKGIAIDLVEVRSHANATEGAPLVVAWVENGKANLDYDGREARPNEASIVGSGKADGAFVALTLKSTAKRDLASSSESREFVVQTRATQSPSTLRRRTARRGRGL